MNDNMKQNQTARLARRLAVAPDFEPPQRLLQRLGLNDDDVEAMKARAYIPPDPTLEALRGALAPIQAAAEAAKDALQTFLDTPNPSAQQIREAVQTMAEVTVAITEINTDPDPMTNPVLVPPVQG